MSFQCHLLNNVQSNPLTINFAPVANYQALLSALITLQ